LLDTEDGGIRLLQIVRNNLRVQTA